ncbi:putative DNA-binding transcriptional regulator YafY [Marmoricola sp. URHA0025 HA25]
MTTGSRMLELLSLLQTHRYWAGAELAGRLEVSERTLRRDIERIRDLGYPVDAVRGVAGGYQLRAGGTLPPLLLTDEEAVAIAVGLRSAASGAVQGLEETAVQSLTKVLSLMPPRLRQRMDALAAETIPAPMRGPSIDATTLTTLAQGCRDDEVLEFDYTAREAETTHRRVEPHRLVSLGQRWYLVAFDRDRDDWRSFRVDRISDAALAGRRFSGHELPAADALEFVRSGFQQIPRRYDVRVLIRASKDTVSAVTGRWAELTEVDRGTLMEMPTDDLFWPLAVLAAIDAEFEVESPAELREQVSKVGARFRGSRAAPARARSPRTAP